tara:strand:- start:23566 stop:24321 length:756 start_codon:yes stop_codon:yes gene_type:complete
MDASVWRAVIVTTLLLGGVLAVLVVGKLFLFSGDNAGIFSQIEGWLEATTGSPLALAVGLLAVTLIFCVSAFIGAPQFGLVAVTVAVFGPVIGFFFAWTATLVSQAMAFWIGRTFGMSLVRRYGGDSILRLSRFMGKNDFIASMIVRNVPTAPAIVVNMAFGASEARFIWFQLGGALGSIPKILIIALFGEAVAQSMTGNPVFAGIAVAVVALIWIPIMLLSRSNLVREKRPSRSKPPPSETQNSGELEGN